LDSEEVYSKIAGKKHCILYLNPANHFPTGISISAKRRRELLDKIKKLNIPIIENDTLRDIGTDLPPPFKAEDTNGQIIYIGSFASTYFNASKTAWVVAPAAVTERLCDIKMQYYSGANTVLELLAYIMLSSGKYAECMGKIRATLNRRVIYINDILNRYLSGIAFWDKKSISYHVWLRFIPEIDTDRIFTDCPGIGFVPGSALYDKRHILLNSASTALEDFETAVRRIASAARRQLKINKSALP
jgi:GntR family transcriptional regulator of abcA and norABC